MKVKKLQIYSLKNQASGINRAILIISPPSELLKASEERGRELSLTPNNGEQRPPNIQQAAPMKRFFCYHHQINYTGVQQ